MGKIIKLLRKSCFQKQIFPEITFVLENLLWRCPFPQYNNQGINLQKYPSPRKREPKMRPLLMDMKCRTLRFIKIGAKLCHEV